MLTHAHEAETYEKKNLNLENAFKKTIRGKDQKNLLLDNLCFLLRQK